MRMLCEANIAGAQLPAAVVDFMARHSMVHGAECAENIDGDHCFFDKPILAVNDECKLAVLLQKWDIRSAFAVAAGGGGGGGGRPRSRSRSRSRSPPSRGARGGAGGGRRGRGGVK